MFYSNHLLNIRTGKLGIAWLLATNRLQILNKKNPYFHDVLQANIEKICNDILVHVVARNLDERPRRFSLYLSSMLMSGTVKIYLLQVNFLFGSLSEMSTSLHRFQQGKISSLDNNEPLARGQTRMCEQPTTSFFGLTTLDFDDLLMPPLIPKGPSYLLSSTPRKIEGPPLLRDDPADQELSTLLKEWDEELLPFPNLARLQDITMREDDVLHAPISIHQQPMASLQAEPLDNNFGPPSEDFLNGIALYQPSHVQSPSEATVKSTDIPPPQVITEVPLAAKGFETPAQPTQPPSLQRIMEKKAPPKSIQDQTLPDRTPQPPRSSSDRDEPMQLESIKSVRVERRRVRAKRKLRLMDENHKLVEGILRRQVEHYQDTMRHPTPTQDIVNVRWWKRIKPVQQLLQKTHRHLLNTDLQELITRQYVTNASDARFDDFNGAKRKLEMRDLDTSERARLGETTEMSAISHQSSLPHDASKVSSTDRSSSLLETPAMVPLASEVPPLLPIPEELHGPTPYYIEQDIPKEMPPKDRKDKKSLAERAVALPERAPGTLEPEEVLVLSALRPLLEGAERREKVSLSPDFGPQQLIVKADVHREEILPPSTLSSEVPTPSAIQLMREGTERRETRKAPSPDPGFAHGIIQVEVHAQQPPEYEASLIPSVNADGRPTLTDNEEEVSAVRHQRLENASTSSTPAGPHLPLGPLVTSELSPIGSPRHSRVLTTPTPPDRVQAVTLNSVKKRKETTFEQLLPLNPTRRDVVRKLSAILELHKKRKIRVNQTTPYGTITIQYLS